MEYENKDIVVGGKYRVKYAPDQFGRQFHWLQGLEVEVTGELSSRNFKYPVTYDKGIKPDGEEHTHALSIRGDLLEPIQ